MSKTEQEGLCTRIAVSEGLVSMPLNMNEIAFVSRMGKYMFDENHFPLFHSWNDEWFFRDVSSQEIAERTVARMRLCGFLLKDAKYCDRMNIHVWCSDDTLAFALAKENPDGDIPVMTVAYTCTYQHHMDLVDKSILSYIDYTRVLEDGRKLTGFESYPIHNLKSFLKKVGVLPRILENGFFKSDAPARYPDLDGASVLEATDESMAVLGLIYNPC